MEKTYSDTPNRTRHLMVVVVRVVVVAMTDAVAIAIAAPVGAGRTIARAESLSMGLVEPRFGVNVKERGFMNVPD